MLTARTEVTDRMLIFGERHLCVVMTEYVAHYNGRRPHRSRELRPPRPDHPIAGLSREQIKRQPVLGGLLNEYERAACKPRSRPVAEFWNPTGRRAPLRVRTARQGVHPGADGLRVVGAQQLADRGSGGPAGRYRLIRPERTLLARRRWGCGAGAGTGPVRPEDLYAERAGYTAPRRLAADDAWRPASAGDRPAAAGLSRG